MGRSSDSSGIRNRIKDVRIAAGITQAQLAVRAGITRQATSAIEMSKYVPNTTVSLHIAEVLGCRVDDIFTLGSAPFPGEALHVVSAAQRDDQRLAAGFVRNRLGAYPLAGDRAVREGLIVPDVLQTAGARRSCRRANGFVVRRFCSDATPVWADFG